MQYTYYKFDASRLTLAELWRSCNNPLEFAIAAICKAIRVNAAPRFGLARTDRLVRISAGAVPAFAQARITPLIQLAEALGMLPGFYFTIPTAGALEGYSFLMRSSDGQSVLSIDCIRITVGTLVNEKATFHFISTCGDGRYLVTSGSKREENTPPGYDGRYLPGRSLDDVLQCHRQRLAEQAAVPHRIADNDQLERMIFAYERGVMDFQIERRVFVPLAADEVQELKGMPRPDAAATATEPQGGGQPALRLLEWASWFALLFGIFLFSKEHANQAQLLFRAGLLGCGLLGVIVFQVLRLMRTKS
jgi:hypothetical protein